MTKLKSPGSRTSAESELIETVEAQSAELRLLRKEVGLTADAIAERVAEAVLDPGRALQSA